MTTASPIAPNEVRFQSLLDNSPELILYQNVEGTILDTNPAFLALVGQTKEQVLQRNYHDFLPPDVREVFLEKLREAVTTGKPVRFDLYASHFRQASSACHAKLDMRRKIFSSL